MKIVYPPFVNHEGHFNAADADLEGAVYLRMTVKGKAGHIALSAKEAAALFRELKKLDVEALARIYAA